MKNLAFIAVCAILAAACGERNVAGEKPHLLTMPPSDSPRVSMLALTQGTLTTQSGCVAIQNRSNRSTLVFPPGYTLAFVGNQWQVRDSFGAVVGSIGEHVTIGGGERRDLPFSSSSGCISPYWIVTPRDRREMVPAGMTPPPVPDRREMVPPGVSPSPLPD